MRRWAEDEDGRAGRRELPGGSLHVGEDLLDAVGPIEEGRDEPADDAHPESGEELLQLDRIGGQVAVRPELGRAQPALDHLAEDPVSVHQVAPAR